MSIAANIKFHSDSNSYELLLPDSVKNSFGLKDNSGVPLSIIHQNKMKLEWLAQSIVAQFNKLNDYRIVNIKKLARKKRICLIVLAVCAVVIFFKEGIARALHTTTLYINLVSFGVAIISSLQLLKYFALSISDINKGNFSTDPEIEQIKELILKDYSDHV
jgi:hypothetical protein